MKKDKVLGSELKKYDNLIKRLDTESNIKIREIQDYIINSYEFTNTVIANLYNSMKPEDQNLESSISSILVKIDYNIKKIDKFYPYFKVYNRKINLVSKNIREIYDYLNKKKEIKKDNKKKNIKFVLIRDYIKDVLYWNQKMPRA